MRKPFAILSLLLLPHVAAADNGTLLVFRWNQGYRAEREPVLRQKMSPGEYQTLVMEKKLPANESLYSGCYLAYYEAAPEARTPASLGQPKSELHRICLGRQTH